MSKVCPAVTPPPKPGFTPGGECVCPSPTPTMTPTITPSVQPDQCRYEWLCVYDCHGTPPDWGAPGKTGQFCVMFDDCIDSQWWFDEASSTEQYQAYRKTTCEWVCSSDTDCFDHTPVTPPKPSFTPVQCPTATPTDEPTATPTDEPTGTPTEEPTGTPTASPTPDPDDWFCVTYTLYDHGSHCGTFVSQNQLCMQWHDIHVWDDCQENYTGYYDVIINYVSGPYSTSLECQGECA